MVTVQKNADAAKLSVKSSDIISNEKFPLLARFAYGKSYPRLAGFSKLFTLLDSFQVIFFSISLSFSLSHSLSLSPSLSFLPFPLSLPLCYLIK